MKEYNWREERKKFQPEFRREMDTPPHKREVRRSGGIGVGGLGMLLLVIAVIAGVCLYMKSDSPQPVNPLPDTPSQPDKPAAALGQPGKSAGDFSQIAEAKKNALGLVMAEAKFKNNAGNIQVTYLKIGTAWAFDTNHYATNAHVALSIKENLTNFKKDLQISYLQQAAIAARKKTIKEYLDGLEMNVRNQVVAEALVKANEQVISYEPLVAVNGMTMRHLPITHVQIHRNYGYHETFNPDVAILTISGKAPAQFERGGHDKFAALKAGVPVAYLGFPIESLDKENVNTEQPMASMQTGTVVAISDFELKDAGLENNLLIRHNLPLTGGASGSPMFTLDGHVVALLYAGNMNQKAGGGREPSAAMINFAVRVDLLEGMTEPVTIKQFLQN